MDIDEDFTQLLRCMATDGCFDCPEFVSDPIDVKVSRSRKALAPRVLAAASASSQAFIPCPKCVSGSGKEQGHPGAHSTRIQRETRVVAGSFKPCLLCVAGSWKPAGHSGAHKRVLGKRKSRGSGSALDLDLLLVDTSGLEPGVSFGLDVDRTSHRTTPEPARYCHF